jgi:TolB protein
MGSLEAMKRLLILLLLCGTALSAVAEDAVRKLAFERDGKILVANLDGTGAKKVGEGVFPDISPDGTRVALNTQEQKGTTWSQHIVVVEVATGNRTTFKDLPSENVAYPKWSPDGAQVLFTVNDGKNWHLAETNADGTGFRYIRKGTEELNTVNSPCWARDGKSVFFQDMKNIYRVDLEGKEIAHWDIEKSIPNGDMSGAGRIDVSPDGQKLLLGIDMNEEAHRKGWDGPLAAVWVFELASKKATRLTPKKLFGLDGCWVDDSTILFLSLAAGDKNRSLYRMSLPAGTISKPLARDVSQPTVSR